MNNYTVIQTPKGDFVGKYSLVYDTFAFKIEKTRLAGDFQTHTHDFSELVVIIRGSATHVIDGEEYPIRPGDVYVLNGDTSHAFKAARDLELCNIMYNPCIFEPWGTELKKLSGFHALFVLEPFYRKKDQFRSKLQLKPQKRGYVLDMLQAIQDEFDQRNEGYEIVIDSYFRALTIFLCREYGSEPTLQSKELLSLAEVCAVIEKNYLQPLSIKQLAGMVPMSVRHFIRVYKENFHATPMNRIVMLRLQHACGLLQKGSISITQAAYDSGFSDSNYFTRLFRKYYGMKPREFRKIYC